MTLPWLLGVRNLEFRTEKNSPEIGLGKELEIIVVIATQILLQDLDDLKFPVEQLPRVNTEKDEEKALDNISAIGRVGGDGAAGDKIKNYAILMHIKRILTACEKCSENYKRDYLRSDREKQCDKTYQTVTICSVSYICHFYIT